MRILIWLILIYIGYKIMKGMLTHRKPGKQPSMPDVEALRDPVCGVYVSKDDAVIGNLQGQRIYFCSMSCLETYRDQLDKKEQEAIRH